MDAIAYRPLGWIQSYHGLHPILCVVHRKDFPAYFSDHVVPVDISQVTCGSVAEFRMEIFVANKYVQFTIGGSHRYIRMALLEFRV
jgi:hypothetical protein